MGSGAGLLLRRCYYFVFTFSLLSLLCIQLSFQYFSCVLRQVFLLMFYSFRFGFSVSNYGFARKGGRDVVTLVSVRHHRPEAGQECHRNVSPISYECHRSAPLINQECRR
jgi:hypothetical protein